MLLDMIDLSGKKALVTGGAKRIGKAIALALAAEGADVVVHYNASQSDAEATTEEIRGTGVHAWPLQADLSVPGVAQQAMADAIALADGIEILVNNASVFTESNLDSLSAENVARDAQLHSISSVELARPMVAQGTEGVIVNMLDTRVASACVEHLSYYLSKRMLLDLTRIMAMKYAPKIRVNGVAPGLILPPPGLDQSYMETRASGNAMKRVGTPEEVAEAVVFLTRNAFVTGQVIFVDGGEHLKGAVRG